MRPASCRSASSGSRTSRCPTARRVESWLRAECERGLARRYGDASPPELQARLDYELGVIISMGYAGYFLIVADFVRFAREQGIQTTCRGSAPGSIVTYTLGITPVDPIAYELPFERFLNPDRVTMPDIDVDFEDDRRDEVIAYVTPQVRRRTTSPRSSPSGRCSPGPRSATSAASSATATATSTGSRRPSRTSSGSGSRRPSRSARSCASCTTPTRRVKRVIDFAQQLEGVARNASTHAAGVVISREPLTELMPLQKATNSDALMTQYEMHAIEALGLLKFDFLGLSNLTILRHAVDLIRAHRGVEIDLDQIPLDDADDVRAPRLGRDDRHLPARVGGHAALHPRAPADVGLRPRGDGRALPARARWTTSRPTSGASTARRR